MLKEMEGRINRITSENLELERQIEVGKRAKTELFKNREELKDLMQDYFSEVRCDMNG